MQTFTIIICYVLFELTAMQLSKELKSVLYNYFLNKDGKLKEKSEALVLHSDPAIFQTIHHYLDGYDISWRLPMAISDYQEYSNRLADISHNVERFKAQNLKEAVSHWKAPVPIELWSSVFPSCQWLRAFRKWGLCPSTPLPLCPYLLPQGIGSFGHLYSYVKLVMTGL